MNRKRGVRRNERNRRNHGNDKRRKAPHILQGNEETKVEVGLYLERLIEERGMKKERHCAAESGKILCTKTVWRSANPTRKMSTAVCVSPFS